jgi:hypothetical protein
VRQASDQVRSGGLVPIPATIMDHYRKVVLCVDVMKVNKIPFLVTISRALKFGTVAWLKNAKITTIMSAITDVRNIYVKHGFLLEIVEVDGQFEPLRGELAPLGITLNKCSREEHVPVVERRIRTLKERCRCIHNTLPFKKMPGMLVVQMVSACNFWLNIYPPKDGVSRSINPRELMTGIKIDYNKHIHAEFGEYVQVHEEHDNSMKTCTTGAIATKPTGNAQGGHWFYSLTTGRMLDRQKWTPLPMPDDVIERINVLAKAGQVGMNFTNSRNEEYDDDDNSEGSDDSDSDDSDYDDDSSDGKDDDYDDFIAGVNGNNLAPDPPTNVEGDDEDDDDDEDPIVEVENGIDENTDETFNNDDDDIPEDNVPEDDDEELVVTPALKKLTDTAGALPPVMQSRTRQQANETGDNLLIGVSEKSITKKQRLETNGRGSSGKRTRHINVRYFFVADRVKSKEIRIEHCPTGIMLADYFTKPQQGVLFRQMRDMIMGNIDIPRPTDKVLSVTDKTIGGIPNASSTSESRSVLGMENNRYVKNKGRSTGSVENKGRSSTGHRISVKNKGCSNTEHVEHVEAKKRIISWAEIASRGIKK